MNGFKFSVNKNAFFGDEIQNLKNMIEVEDFEKGNATLVKHNILDD